MQGDVIYFLKERIWSYPACIENAANVNSRIVLNYVYLHVPVYFYHMKTIYYTPAFMVQNYSSTVYVQIFEVRNFRGWPVFRIFAILFSRIAFYSEKFAVLFSRIGCPQGLNAAEIAYLCIVTLNTSQQQQSKCNVV